MRDVQWEWEESGLEAGEKGLKLCVLSSHTDLGAYTSAATCQLCDLRQVIEPLWAFSLICKLGKIIPPHRVVEKIKRDNPYKGLSTESINGSFYS